MPTIRFVNEKREIQVPEGANLRKECLRAGVKIYNGINGYGARVNEIFNCHGLGHCATCRVLITKGQENVSKKSWWESFALKVMGFLADVGREKEMRLACRTKVYGDIDVVTKPPLNMCGENFFS